MRRCPASYPEPPGYIFEEVDPLGHRIYRAVSQVGSQRNSHLPIDDAENPKQRELAVSA
jgi:DNA topoisomerase VI subunit A